MENLRRSAKPICQVLVLLLLTAWGYVPVAKAGIIGTETVVNAEHAQQQRAHITSLLDRTQVKNYLAARGVDSAYLQSRVDSLTDAEVEALAGRLDRLPAGGDLLTIALIAFIVLVILDAVGVTDIFPFIKSKKSKSK
ncbi:MAG: PA2779 family protein [Acidiferrobacterales bacterium]|nr:PA2779 family protein [Acidiferrobacterales bacterium]